jgi:leucyl aminopeptidase
MKAQLKNRVEVGDCKAKIYIIDTQVEYSNLINSTDYQNYVISELKRKNDLSSIRLIDELVIFLLIEEKDDELTRMEFTRRKAADAYALLKTNNFENVALYSNNNDLEEAFVEGLVLSAYQFDKYKTEKESFSLNSVYCKNSDSELQNLLSSVCWARDLVNEPPAHQTATALAKEFEKMSSEIEGLDIEVFNKVQIESLRMGGLLAVNRGSVEGPTFTVLKWNPENAVNEKPIVLVGKGVVYDTGGINLKPTGFLETMKSDMSGSAVVTGLIRAIADNNLPVNVIALVPATDNRPGKDAYVPSDIVTMMSGKTVEVINTDAEGRMVLADGLNYSEKFEPELVFSVATLTGAAARAFGTKVFVSMGNAKEELQNLYQASLVSGERCWELPFWEDFGDELKSNIADIKHLGGANAGAITAGKFLENFTSSPYIHLDIAGVSYLEKQEDYKPIGGTGVGIRALYIYLKNYISEKQSS